MKRRVCLIIGICVCFGVILLCGSTKKNKEQLLEQENDRVVIPDKYNTGANGELTKVTEDCFISGVKFGTTGKTDRKLDLYYQKGEIPSSIIVENYDFSASDFREYNVGKVDKQVTILYKNCKFRSYVISGEGLVERRFENCTFTHFSGSQATFDKCYFGGGSEGDGINPIKDCTFTNCMIADLIRPADEEGTKHIDGFQIFGSKDGTNNENIILENCRFEVPYMPFTTPSGAMNCPVSIIMRFSDAKDITFRNCYINGGQYYGMMLFANDRNITNLTVENLYIGGNSKSLYACDKAFETMLSQNVTATNTLYAASVRKEKDGIHVSVTNDTTKERNLSILTNHGMTEYKIPACFIGRNLQIDSVTYKDYPFDLDIVVEDADWIACFDTTDEVQQIRFVNWTKEKVYVDMDALFSK